MRLIDVDKLPITCNAAIINGKLELDGWVSAKRIDEAPTVEAIPIEWLLKERNNNKEIAETLSKVDLNIDFIAKYGYTRSFHKVLMIEELLLDWRNWEKENE